MQCRDLRRVSPDGARAGRERAALQSIQYSGAARPRSRFKPVFRLAAHPFPPMIPPSTSPCRRFAALLLGAAMAVGACLPARADEQADINRLIAAGQTTEALTRLNRLLEQRPR